MKKHLTKRVLALLLTLAMVLSLLPMSFAEEPAADEYVLAAELQAGSQVVIVNAAAGKAISNADSTAANNPERYRLGVDVAPADGKLSAPEAQIVWTVEVTDDGIAFKDAEGRYLSVPSGYNNLVLDSDCKYWTVSQAATADSVYLVSTASAGGQGDLRGIEYYGGKFTTFYASETNIAANEAAFALQLYVRAESVEPPAGELSGKTIILHTNDTHGALMGFAQAAKVKADLEAQGATVLLVDAGDYSQGNPYVSLSKGETAITVMNAAGYDYATLGNHEFDYGWPQLRENLSKATFQPIVADVIDEATGKSVYDGHAIKEVDGVKIGFFGMETPEAATKANPALMVGLRFPQAEEMYAIAQAEIDALKAEGADLVICLAHLGVDAESEPNRSTDLFAHVTGLDFIIDGHSHTVMTEGPNGEPIQSTGTKASDTALANLGYICIDNATKRIEEHKLIPLGADAPVDETVAAVAREIMDAVNAEYDVVFARSEVELNGDRAPGNRNMETNLGDLITDAMLWSVAKTGGLTVDADHVVAITNGGGIRAWIHAGDVTKKDVNTVLPFGNTVAVVYVSGAELLEALEASTYCTPTAIGGFPQVSGMKFSVSTYLPFLAGEQYPGSTYYGPKAVRRVTIEEIGGKAFDPEATYAVVTNNFCAAGGDTYYAFKAATSQFDTGLPLDEVLMDYIVEELDAVIGAEYAEPQGRITIHEHFDDVTSQEQYYYDPVYWAVAHDPQITAGIGSNLFGPDVDCTREMVVTFLWKAYGGEIVEEGKAAGFSDVPEDAYYVNAVRWAVAKGVTGGVGDGKFGVGQVCTRAEVVTFLWAAAGKPKPKTAESPFNDVKEGDWFLSPVLWAVENGVTGGTGDGQFSPAMTCTRAQIVTFLYKAMQIKPELCFPSASNDDIAKYGNIYTNYEGADFFAEGYTWGDIVTVKFLDWELELPIVPTFSYVDSGTPGVFVNKDGETGEPTGRMFMAINMGSFAEAYGLAIKTTNPDKTYFWTPVEGVEFPVPVSIEMKEAGGYLMEMNIRDINRTNNREDYPALTDEEFANFRRITTTGMGDHLYRGSSPINPEIGRNTYADAALENAGVTVVMNLANSQADAEAYPGFAESYYAGQNVIYLNLGVDFFAEEFKTGLAAGLRHFAENEGVYYVHCTEGKDRAGFVSALLECFMGASCDEVVADYLKTYTNYYNVVDGVQQPLSEETLNAIAESNIIRTLQRAFAVEDLTSADLAAEAEEYLSELGLSAEELAALRTNLGGEYPPEEPESGFTASSALPENGKQYALIARNADGKFYALDNFETEKELKTATEVSVDPATLTISELPETVLFDAVVDGDSIQFMVGTNYLHLNASKLRVVNGTANSHLSFTKVAGSDNLFNVSCTENGSVMTFNGERFSASTSEGTEPAQLYLFTLR